MAIDGYPHGSTKSPKKVLPARLQKPAHSVIDLNTDQESGA